MYKSAEILEAARSIRPYLRELLPPSEAKAIDKELAKLLEKASTGESIKNQILELLRNQDSTREWLLDFLQDKQKPDNLRNFSPLAGTISIVKADKFVCPEGDYTWYRPRVGIEPPLCPTHNIPLEPA